MLCFKPFALFSDRLHAGQIVSSLDWTRGISGNDIQLVCLPRGGLIVAKPIAEKLGIDVNSIIVRKLGQPGNSEWSIGALVLESLDSSPMVWLDDAIPEIIRGTKEELSDLIEKETIEAQRRFQLYKPKEIPTNQTIILVDDGIATGICLLVAIQSLLCRNPRQIHVVVPVARQSGVDFLSKLPKVEIHCPHIISNVEFGSVGRWFVDFSDVSDHECLQVLKISN